MITSGAGVYFVLWVFVVHPVDGVQDVWRMGDYEEHRVCQGKAWTVNGMSRTEHMLPEPLILHAVCERSEVA